MADILIILQARLSSSRLPGKVLKTLHGKPMLEQQIARFAKIQTPYQLVVATSEQPEDDAIALLCKKLDINCFRGELNDVLSRFYHAATHIKKQHDIQHIVRITGDCPVIDAKIIDQVIALYLAKQCDYCSNCAPATFPDGLDVEVFSLAALKTAFEQAQKPSEREHVTLFIRNNPNLFTLCNYQNNVDLSHLRWTVDEPADFEFVTQVYRALYPQNKYFDFNDILTLLQQKPELCSINLGINRNEGLIKSVQQDNAMDYRS